MPAGGPPPPAGLAAWLPQLSAEEVGLAADLLADDQASVFAEWGQPGVTAAQVHAFFDQVRGLNGSYPGGLAAYTATARRFLSQAASAEGAASSFAGLTPSVGSGVSLDMGTPEFERYEALGLEAISGASVWVCVWGGG